MSFAKYSYKNSILNEHISTNSFFVLSVIKFIPFRNLYALLLHLFRILFILSLLKTKASAIIVAGAFTR